MEIVAAATRLLAHDLWLTALLAIVIGSIIVKHARGRKLRLPPGPVAVPIFGNWLQVGDDLNPRNLSEMAQKYGEIFMLRLGQRKVVVVSSPELAKQVLQTQGLEFGSRARNVVYDVFTNKGQDMGFAAYGDHWRRMKKIMTVPFFSSKAVQQSRFAREEEIEHVIRDVMTDPKASTTGIVIRHRLQMMMYNIMYRMMFGRRFERLDDPLFEKLRFLNSEKTRLAQSLEYNYGDFIPLLRPFLYKYLQTCRRVRDQRLALFNNCFVQVRRKLSRENSNAQKVGADDLFDAMDREEINEEQLLYIIENINAAALETTLWSIEWGIAEAVNNPRIQEKMSEELDRTLGGAAITEPDIGKLPYLEAVVKETLRHRMPLPLLLPHMNLQEAKLAGYDIPSDTRILVNVWWIAHDPRLWDRPEEFRPERFLEQNTEANGNDFKFLPFGSGRRSCPGIMIAFPLLQLLFGRLFQTFTLSVPPGVDRVDMTEKGGQFTVNATNNHTFVLKRRGP